MLRHTSMFELTKQHLALLTRACVGWNNCEAGAPEIDPKRPYGNSDVANDVADILGLKNEKKCDECGRGNIDEAALLKIHHETLQALQIILGNLDTTPKDLIGAWYKSGTEYHPVWVQKGA